MRYYTVVIDDKDGDGEEAGILEHLENILGDYEEFEGVEFDIQPSETTPIILSKADRKLLRDTVRVALQLSQTQVALTHPSNPIYDRLEHSQVRLAALYKAVR